MLPFFAFDYWFYAVEPIFNELILLEVAGNITLVALYARGYALLTENRRRETLPLSRDA